MGMESGSTNFKKYMIKFQYFFSIYLSTQFSQLNNICGVKLFTHFDPIPTLSFTYKTCGIASSRRWVSMRALEGVVRIVEIPLTLVISLALQILIYSLQIKHCARETLANTFLHVCSHLNLVNYGIS